MYCYVLLSAVSPNLTVMPKALSGSKRLQKLYFLITGAA